MARDGRRKAGISQSLFAGGRHERQHDTFPHTTIAGILAGSFVCYRIVMAPPKLILASSSRFRQHMLTRLGVAFTTVSPDIDETSRAGEPAIELVQRLARGKAERVAAQHPAALVIGSDQVAELDGAIIGKPGDRATAIKQLQRQSGRTVAFHTGLCLLAPGQAQPSVAVDTVMTRFRVLTTAEIERYVDAEDVTATAGSIKSEGLGIALLEAIESSDPTALIGLPLIALRRMLAQAGMALP